MLSRIIWGTRASLTVGAMVIFFATTVGIFMGLVSGYYGGRVDVVIQRLVDILLAFPYLVLAIGLMARHGARVSAIMIFALVYKEWVTPSPHRAGRSAGREKVRSTWRRPGQWARGTATLCGGKFCPTRCPSVIVVATLRVAWVILMEASLSFLGLGVQPPDARVGLHGGRGQGVHFQLVVAGHLSRPRHFADGARASTCWAKGCGTRWTRA